MSNQVVHNWVQVPSAFAIGVDHCLVLDKKRMRDRINIFWKRQSSVPRWPEWLVYDGILICICMCAGSNWPNIWVFFTWFKHRMPMDFPMDFPLKKWVVFQGGEGLSKGRGPARRSWAAGGAQIERGLLRSWQVSLNTTCMSWYILIWLLCLYMFIHTHIYIYTQTFVGSFHKWGHPNSWMV
jgi:hypothetical protein